MRQISASIPASPLLSVRRLRVTLRRRRLASSARSKALHVIENLDLDLARGETVGVIGESGCGKTTLGRALSGILPASSGSIRFEGRELFGAEGIPVQRCRYWLISADLPERVRSRARLERLFDPLLGRLFPEWSPEQRRARTLEVLGQVGLGVGDFGRRWSSFSPPEAARIRIAVALASQPGVLICDEPTVGLTMDESMEVIDLLGRLKDETGVAMLLLTAQPRLVAPVSDRIVSMYLGRIVEQGEAEGVCATPAHPYTRAVLQASPTLDHGCPRLWLEGDRPDPGIPPIGCVFHPRCPMADAVCVREPPHLRRTGPWPRHYAACLFAPQPEPT